jgi:hypothetical protein
MLNIKGFACWVKFFKRRLFYLHIYLKTIDKPGAGPVLTPGLLFKQPL